MASHQLTGEGRKHHTLKRTPVQMHVTRACSISRVCSLRHCALVVKMWTPISPDNTPTMILRVLTSRHKRNTEALLIGRPLLYSRYMRLA